MKTSTFKSICESAKRVMLGEAEAPVAPEAEAPVAPEADAAPTPEAPEAPEAEESEEAPKASKGGKPKYVAQCSKDGEDTVLLLSKEDLETLIHEQGAKCIVKLYELGKEAKVPEVKV
jgi:hypothetical protein